MTIEASTQEKKKKRYKVRDEVKKNGTTKLSYLRCRKLGGVYEAGGGSKKEPISLNVDGA